MKRIVLAALLASLALFVLAASKTYQVTGPVLELRDDAIVVQKGKEKWEIARGAETKVKGDLKVGAKVTIEYRMSAATVETKDAGKTKDDAKAKKRKSVLLMVDGQNGQNFVVLPLESKR